MSTGNGGSSDLVRVGDAEREGCVQALIEHHVAGALTVDELTERQSLAYGATTVGQLRALTADLPSSRRHRGVSPAGIHRGALSAARIAPSLAPPLAIIGFPAAANQLLGLHYDDRGYAFAVATGLVGYVFARLWRRPRRG